jgi:hypothetical protein
MKPNLLSRDAFRESVFQRDNHQCVICKKPAVDAHHILERRLWPDGGYYNENGASVCGHCHIECEKTEISVEEIREATGIKKAILPPHLYDDQIYDKWGNIILPNGTRLIGDLFFDESVQKILEGKLHLFIYHIKYPRTYHLPWSESVGSDDRILPSLEKFVGKEIIVTEKRDGECTTWYTDYTHARSVDSKNHPSRNFNKQQWSKIAHDIPKKWRICGENLYAKHSIFYDNLESYFEGFSIWNEKNNCLSWDESLLWFELLNIKPVPLLYRGIFDVNILKELWKTIDPKKQEGYVIRLAGEFPYGAFRESVAKCVRKNHIQTVQHWMHGQPITPNQLAK